MLDFIDEYFIQPIYVEQGYNLVNTTVYALVALLLLYLIYKLFQRIKFKIDLKFFLAMIPFIFLGSSIRAFVDNNYLARNFWFISPGIWMLTATIFLLVFFISYLITKEDYWKFSLVTGTVFVIIAYALIFDKIQLTNFVGAVAILIIFSILALGFYSFSSAFKLEWVIQRLSFLAFSAHLFDATNTFILTDFFGGIEKHPIPRFFIEKLGTGAVFYPLKLIVLLPALYLIYTEIKDKQLRNFLLIAIAVLGFAEGLRNFISLVLI